MKLKLRHNISKKPKNIFNRLDVYKLNCNECDNFYIGQTGRTFDIRFREHTYRQNKTAFGVHMKDTKHNVSSITENMEILHMNEKGRKLDLLENLNIFCWNKKAPDKILNEQLDVNQKKFFEMYEDILLGFVLHTTL